MDGSREEIWAYGLRNPWKFPFDSLTTDRWAADVGQNRYEEVDPIQPIGNDGWKTMAGFHYCVPSIDCDQSGLELPVFEYDNREDCSVTGSHFYRGGPPLRLYSAYVYCDLCSGRVWTLRYDGVTVTDQALLVDTDLQIPSFGVDEWDRLHILAFDGRIYRFARPDLPSVPGLTH